MKFHKLFWLARFATLTIVLSSCNMGATPAPTIDAGAVQTQAYNGVLTQAASQQTSTALAQPTATQTNTPEPTVTEQPTFVRVGETSTPTSFEFAVATATQIAGFTPLPTSLATKPTPTTHATITTKNGCSDGTYLSETAPYDGAQMTPSEKFSKGWKILNTGSCVWDEGYKFAPSVKFPSLELRGESTEITFAKNKSNDFIKPGQAQLFILKLQAPKTPGKYSWYWKLQDDGGNAFGPLVSITFVVAR